MSREVKRVAADFDWPLHKVWVGYKMPEFLHETDCAACEGSGYSPHARYLKNLWYGYAPFLPEDNGCEPLTRFTPAVVAFAERNVRSAPEYYGTSPYAVQREAQRLAELWNGMWFHHVTDEDVAALVEHGRLMDFTHTWTKGQGWVQIEPPVVPTAAQVNEWSIQGFGHDSFNASICVTARCEREGHAVRCASCEGNGTHEAYPGQRGEREAWTRTDPPEGGGWQLWETISEGSPISPVFHSAEGLAQWLTTPESSYGDSRPMTIETARAFVAEGWAPTFVGNAGGLHDGAEFVGSRAVLREFEDDE